MSWLLSCFGPWTLGQWPIDGPQPKRTDFETARVLWRVIGPASCQRVPSPCSIVALPSFVLVGFVPHGAVDWIECVPSRATAMLLVAGWDWCRQSRTRPASRYTHTLDCGWPLEWRLLGRPRGSEWCAPKRPVPCPHIQNKRRYWE